MYIVVPLFFILAFPLFPFILRSSYYLISLIKRIVAHSEHRL